MNIPIYIVFIHSNDGKSKKVGGIYFDLKKAIQRQKEICQPNPISGVNGSYSAHNNVYLTTFINEFHLGDSDIELFTTIPNSLISLME